VRPEEQAVEEKGLRDERPLHPVPPQAEHPSGERRRRVPTSVLVTLVVAMFSVLIGPAFARQWEDQQKARELKAAIADEIATATARTLGAGVYVARAQDTLARRERLAKARAFWRPASLRIETKLRAYFPPGITSEWEQFALDIDDFLVNVCAKASPPGQGSELDLTDADRRANIAGWFEALARAQPLPKSLRYLRFSEIAATATNGSAEERAGVIEAGGDWMFAETDTITGLLFGAHPAGFSTTRGDLLHDLVPG
jgi:hypothetical protein